MIGKVALVTGGSRGIGKATVMTLARAGMTVALHYRSGKDEAHAIQDQLRTEGVTGTVHLFQCDLSDSEAAPTLVKSVKETCGSLDVLVNNAGITADQILAFAKPEDFDRLMNTNLKPVFLLSKHAAKVMLRQRSGRIINISSVVGHTGNAGQSLYSASKAAITAFTQSIAQELAPAGILANTVAPGFIATEMTANLTEDVTKAILAKVPMKRLGTPEEVAHVVKFLASPEASLVTGTTIHVNGGLYTT